MKANDSDKEKNEATFSGIIIKEKTASGSKSEHNAIFLQTTEKAYQLRRPGANAFADPELQKWVGKKVIITGIIYGALLMISTIKKIT